MIFVTGGTGLIGSHLLYSLVSTGKTVRALRRETSNIQQTLKIFSYYSPKAEELFNQVEWVTGDILNYFELESILKGIHEVYHCAAIVSFAVADKSTMIYNIVQVTSNLVNACIEN